jgi:NTE family protein
MKVGLVFSGGGARGFAHLGVLKALNELKIPIHELAGTSAGAIAGAFHGHGYAPEETFGIISKTGFLKSVRPAWTWTGLLSLDGLRDVLFKYLPENDFSALKIPLVIAATEIRLGKIVYFNSGELVPAIIASSTIPTLFSPYNKSGQLFVDGGLMDNFPVRPLVGKCDVIIGSHCNPVAENFDARNVKEVTERSLNLAINASTQHSKTHCSIVIEPPGLGKYSTFDLGKATEIYEYGYRHTLSISAKIEEVFNDYEKISDEF